VPDVRACGSERLRKDQALVGEPGASKTQPASEARRGQAGVGQRRAHRR
jgi:hypothetical protein